MASKEFVVRIIKPSSKPALPKTDPLPANINRQKNAFISKTINVLIGSGVGLTAGIVIYLMLKAIGLNIGGVESSFIIGLPSILMILASFVIC